MKAVDLVLVGRAAVRRCKAHDGVVSVAGKKGRGVLTSGGEERDDVAADSDSAATLAAQEWRRCGTAPKLGATRLALGWRLWQPEEQRRGSLGGVQRCGPPALCSMSAASTWSSGTVGSARFRDRQ
jgi:hypothetical protein